MEIPSIFISFPKAVTRIRPALYGFKGASAIAANQFNITTGTAFMIAPGVLVTVAHALHRNNNPAQPRHGQFQVIRSPDIGQQMERCIFVSENAERDIAILRIENPRATDSVTLRPEKVPSGTSCGSLGFPLGNINQNTGAFQLAERFQSACVSAFITNPTPSGRQLSSYETDALMYKGSSGCPAFLKNGKVFAMHNASMVDRPANTAQEAADSESQSQGNRLAISLWIPAQDIISFAKENEINL